MIYEKINKQVDHLITKVTNINFSLLLGVIPQTTVHTSIQDVCPSWQKLLGVGFKPATLCLLVPCSNHWVAMQVGATNNSHDPGAGSNNNEFIKSRFLRDWRSASLIGSHTDSSYMLRLHTPRCCIVRVWNVCLPWAWRMGRLFQRLRDARRDKVRTSPEVERRADVESWSEEAELQLHLSVWITLINHCM